MECLHQILGGNFCINPYRVNVPRKELYMKIRLYFMFIFLNPILFANCTSTFSKLCKETYTVACRRVLSSIPP
jgi:hypothetical protein